MSNLKIVEFIRQVKQEAAKIVYPERKDTLVTSAVVFVAVLAMSLFFLLVDTIIYKTINFILNIGG